MKKSELKAIINECLNEESSVPYTIIQAMRKKLTTAHEALVAAESFYKKQMGGEAIPRHQEVLTRMVDDIEVILNTVKRK